MSTISEGQARRIAAWYQSSGVHGRQFATFASTGEIPCTLVDDVDREVASDDNQIDGASGVPFRVWLLRLRVYLESRMTEWSHDLIAGMMVVHDEDVATVNALRSMECNRCGRDWAMGEWSDERGL